MTFKKAKAIFYRLAMPLVINRLRNINGVVIGKRVKLYGLPTISLHPFSAIHICDDVVLCSDSDFTALALNHAVKIATVQPNARISIGMDVGMSGGCIVSACSINIGAESLIGANVLIIDTDFHPLSPINRRHNDDKDAITSAPVNVGRNVFIGTNSIILKGVTIGDDSVVAAGSVLLSDVYPNGSIIGGNPAKVVGSVYKR